MYRKLQQNPTKGSTLSISFLAKETDMMKGHMKRSQRESNLVKDVLELPRVLSSFPSMDAQEMTLEELEINEFSC